MRSLLVEAAELRMLDLDTEETDTRLWSKDKEVVLSLLPLPLLDRSLPESSSDASAVFVAVAVAVVAVVLWRDGASSSGTDTIRVLPVATGPFVLVDLLVGTMVLLCLRSSEAEGLLLLRLYVTLPELNEHLAPLQFAICEKKDSIRSSAEPGEFGGDGCTC